MKKWTKPAITILALAAMSHLTSAQSGGDRMAKPMEKVKTYTGCIEAGASAGTFNLTHAMADMGMGKDAMGKDAMKKGPMTKDAMGKEAMTPASIAISPGTTVTVAVGCRAGIMSISSRARAEIFRYAPASTRETG